MKSAGLLLALLFIIVMEGVITGDLDCIVEEAALMNFPGCLPYTGRSVLFIRTNELVFEYCIMLSPGE